MMTHRDDLLVEECCRWCRAPATLCRSAACDDTPTYPGVLRFGQWVEAEADRRAGDARRSMTVA